MSGKILLIEDWKSRLPRKMVYNGHNKVGMMGRRVPPTMETRTMWTSEMRMVK